MSNTRIIWLNAKKIEKTVYNKGIESGEDMRKMLFKKILTILDTIELYSISLHDTPLKVYEILINDYYSLKLSELREFIDYLYEKRILKVSENGIDLCPAATIYAKSNQNSGVEALALLESYVLVPEIFTFYQEQVKNNEYKTKAQVLSYMDIDTLQFLLQTTIFEVEQENIRFQPKLLKGITSILQEYKDKVQPLVSITLTALYTSSIVSHEDPRIDYKNTGLQMIPYRYHKAITAIIPRKGIPHDRDETKALQSFYKDTLFHEFNHACPICKICIPHMLIASHIKPFRDCAHIFEAIDHNNGLLLCRNHDYLFDQGYLTFDDKGYIIISEQLLAYDNLKESYGIAKNYKLPDEYMTENRRLFLKYHREHIFKKS